MDDDPTIDVGEFSDPFSADEETRTGRSSASVRLYRALLRACDELTPARQMALVELIEVWKSLDDTRCDSLLAEARELAEDLAAWTRLQAWSKI